MPRRVAINPLPWVLDARSGFHLDVESLEPAFAVVSALGFTAVQADVPAGLSVTEYRELLGRFNLGSAPGYFGGDFHLPGTADQLIERARTHARTQLELGLTEVFIAGNIVPERFARPAAGADLATDRLNVVIDLLGQTAEAISAEGLTPALHPHVGSWIETEAETRAVLDGISADVLLFGPDTGHLTWAGADLLALIGDYANRIAGLHLKDVDLAAARNAAKAGANYATSVDQFHVWTEPGRGAVEFDHVFELLPESFDGWAVVEVDVPNIGSAEASTAESARWIRSTGVLSGALRAGAL